MKRTLLALGVFLVLGVSCVNPRYNDALPVRGEYGLRDITNTSATFFYNTTDIYHVGLGIDSTVVFESAIGSSEPATIITVAEVVKNVFQDLAAMITRFRMDVTSGYRLDLYWRAPACPVFTP
jgi:hypothetical protein